MINVNQLISSIQKTFTHQNIVIITSKDLDVLLVQLEVIYEKDTFISNKIRLLKLENSTYFVQEQSPKNEILLRQFKSEDAAKDFIIDRLQIYDKMWDGCGCKIEYYE